jgi:hypothetical protein
VRVPVIDAFPVLPSVPVLDTNPPSCSQATDESSSSSSSFLPRFPRFGSQRDTAVSFSRVRTRFRWERVGSRRGAARWLGFVWSPDHVRQLWRHSVVIAPPFAAHRPFLGRIVMGVTRGPVR